MADFFQHIAFWHWLGLGAILLILELVTTSGFLFWIGMSASSVGFLLWIFPSLNWLEQVLIFLLLSLLSAFFWWLYLRKNPIESDHPTLNRRGEQYINRVFTLETPIQNGVGRIRVEDSIWRVKCHMDLSAGEKVKVVDVDGVVLIVVPAEY